ncbi:MAG TPA: M23 family metallopeptidase [Microthrixaceae bacterium]|nr:M23 family metallopeptidase [Microthrixaceae bacterium]HNE75499.1 M23 family metallopeptidase [Microthrixaceae bacterium]HNH38925.1 M23 family metallopeptidase [Microthrixaceae bacterium]
MRTALVAIVSLLLSGPSVAAPVPAHGPAVPVVGTASMEPVPGPGGYRPPVDGDVVDPFRAPINPYGPGNRGLEYATDEGAPARSIGDGVVVFAGPVARRGVVTVEHPDGLRSSLTGLATIGVARGERVNVGDVLGTTGLRLHLGVRRGDEYIDPASLFGAEIPPLHAVLVPLPP